jgi:nitrite reductase/ring-hydroxylating ferredoxin subunit
MFRPPGKPEFTDVAALAEVPQDGALFVQIAGREVMVARRGADIVAFSGHCTHAFARLSEGRIEGETVICALHGARFDLRTGRALNASCRNLAQGEVQVRGRRVLVKPPA